MQSTSASFAATGLFRKMTSIVSIVHLWTELSTGCPDAHEAHPSRQGSWWHHRRQQPRPSRTCQSWPTRDAPSRLKHRSGKYVKICDHVLEYDLKNAQVLLCALHHVATTLGRGYSSDQLCFWFLRWIHRYVIELVSSRQHCNTLDLGLWRERKHLQAPSQALRPLHIRSHKCMIYNKAFGIAADCGKHAFFQKRSKGHFRIKRNRKYQNRTYHRIQEDQADHEDQYAQIVVCSYQ